MISTREIKSIVVIGIYSVLAAAFFKWNASLFVICFAFIIEMLILLLGAIILRKNLGLNYRDLGLTPILYGSVTISVMCYPLAYIIGSYYNEFGIDEYSNYFLPLWIYRIEIIIIGLFLGIGYLINIKELDKAKQSERFTTDLFRIAIQMFFISFSGLMCILFYKDLYHDKGQLPKWIPIIIMIGLRVFFEVWYLLQKRSDNYT